MEINLTEYFCKEGLENIGAQIVNGKIDTVLIKAHFLICPICRSGLEPYLYDFLLLSTDGTKFQKRLLSIVQKMGKEIVNG